VLRVRQASRENTKKKQPGTLEAGRPINLQLARKKGTVRQRTRVLGLQHDES